jgi:hypothetical protein
MIRAILPEIGLVVLALIVLVFDLTWRGETKRGLGWLTAGGIAAVFLLTVVFSRPGDESVQVWGGMLRHDWLSFSFTLLFMFGAAVTSLFAMDLKSLGQRGEFYLLLLVSTIGMILMASSADLIMLFLAIETTSIPLYILAGFYKLDDKSTESGYKYFLFGAMTSAIMLYGFSLIYGFTGTTDIYEITEMVVSGAVSLTLAIGTLILVMVGFGFKISVVPFHFWAPDVYEGAPTPVAGFLSTASKAAGFAVLMRVLLTVYADPTVKCPGNSSKEYQTLACIFIDRPRGLCFDRRCGAVRVGHCLSCVLPVGLCGHESGCIRYCGGILAYIRFGSNRGLRSPQPAFSHPGDHHDGDLPFSGWYASLGRFRGKVLRLCRGSQGWLSLVGDHWSTERYRWAILLPGGFESGLFVPFRG